MKKHSLPTPKNPIKHSITEDYLTPVAIGSFIGHLITPGIGGVALGGLLGALIKSSTLEEEAMSKIPVFYSFHYENDVMRVQQIRNIGAIEGNSPTSPNEWEQLKRTGEVAVKNWIDQNMKYKRCIIVLIGSETSNRIWVQHEIIKAWNDGKAILGIYIHNVKCPRNGLSKRGKSPFEDIKLSDGTSLSEYVDTYDPSPDDAYGDISKNISSWISRAISNKVN
ncbi:TIR domain-containing protein [Algicola sagamiensis]|uniref:TIR domain-containing protein n=1 Tax=Algicola sagamiensis TaxID=163869 RepID=UPI00035DBA17|nr:TIR domain-containing protein [Algicola sagamiensis]